MSEIKNNGNRRYREETPVKPEKKKRKFLPAIITILTILTIIIIAGVVVAFYPEIIFGDKDSQGNDNNQTSTTAETTEENTEESLPDGSLHVVPEAAGSVYVAGDTGFGAYYFSESAADVYVEMIDKAQKKLDGIADV